MSAAFPRPWSAPRGTPVLHRLATFALVVALHLLLLFLLLRLAPPPAEPLQPPRAPLTVDLLPAAELAPATTRAEAPRPRAGSPRPRAAAEPEPVPPPVAPPVPPPPLPAPTPSIWSQVIPMTREQMAAADIARFPSRAAAGGAGEGERGASAGLGSGDPGPGRGPNGEPLYNADWQRRPTRAQLSFYLPSGRPREGWGMIACRTVPGYRVEDCREIAESPVGSGLSGAVRQAAWQFRVLPPRIGGRSLVGSWVRIRIEYTSDGPE